ncbi:MAG: prolyl-tRNA synthetase associated domain-containing protein [Rhodobiaceae bacterium]|nr:prolyl-tRNA synthetase associated domain-containing protein [Rhodobiaceae bacterium]MCC0012555.1 prolyl-tRNA synthetase associated domain-containing protein [Rhodobiaceae bacterium]MCC0050696.1 prolyl-tRNA synthetase associated domain-containing protein [Rhodobiaceae bacterium]MCC0061762.1 prolyl-tRNA synthetase associated domain-containing protein [Rhodobiaceae bacterium]
MSDSLDHPADGLPTSPDGLFAHLNGLGIETQTVSHPPLFTVEDSQSLRGEIAGGHIKNLFVKDKKGKVFLIVVEEDATVDLKTIHTLIGGSGRVSFGKPELLMKLLGVRPGSVSPFGLINDTGGIVTCILDENLMRHDVLNCHPLVNTMTTSIPRDDLKRFIESTGHTANIVAVSSGN